MSHPNSTIKQRRFKHITEKERYQIEILLKEKRSSKEIANILGKHRRTIEREIARGTIKMLSSELIYVNRYCADVGQRRYVENGRNKGAGLKIGNDHELAKHIERRIIKDKYSPDAVIGEIRAKGLKFKTGICTKTLYNYIDKGIFAKITNKDLPVKRNKKRGQYRRTRVALKNLKGTSIEDRPGYIEDRKEYGHWEMDSLVGKKGESGACLLVLTERKSREQIIRKMPDKTQESVKRTLDELERKYGKRFPEKFKTVTTDNGPEFLNWTWIEKSVIEPEVKRLKVYYAHPYSSWERGSNENANRLIRRFIPKGTDIGQYSDEEIRRIEHWMNNYPRKIHGYKTVKELVA